MHNPGSSRFSDIERTLLETVTIVIASFNPSLDDLSFEG